MADEYDQFFQEDRTQAIQSAVFSLTDSADDAARAQELSKATGTPPALIFPDVKGFENQQKTLVTKGLFDQNRFLREYVAAEPMAAKVSNDDWGQLDTVSAAATKFGGDSALGRIAKAFRENAQLESLPREIGDLENYLKATPGFGNDLIRAGVTATSAGVVGGLRVISGAIAAGAQGAAELYKKAGGSEAWANRLTRDLIIAAQTSMPELMRVPEIQGAIQTSRALKPYLDAGKEPPVGVHPLVDEGKVLQADIDAKNLSEALKEATASTTRERSPELFQKFMEQVVGESEIGISADAVRKLYGEKIPEPGDAILGWVPDIQRQLEIAEATGGDVKVPLADWLAKVDPAIAKELQDHVRARPEGLTPEEAKAPPAAQVVDDPVVAAREAAGIERPMSEQIVNAEAKAARETQLELPVEGTTRLEDRSLFERAAAIGMTQEQYGRYQQLILKRAAEDIKAQTARAVAAERKRQSADWKEKFKEVRAEVTKELESRADFELEGELRAGRVKLRDEMLTDEQRAVLPKEWISKDGIHPDDLAQLYGVDTGGEVVGQLLALQEQRRASGLRPLEFTREVIREEAERRMEQRYGDLEKNILEAAKDQILTQTQLDLLHEETLAAATRAGTELPIKKEEVLKGVRQAFDQTPVKDLSADRFLADAGRAGRAAEMALLKGDAAEAFRQKQRQYMAIAFAAEARILEKEMIALDKTVKPYSARDMDPTKFDPAGRFYVQGLLQQAGYTVRLTPDEIAREIGAYGHGSLADFTAYKQGFGWEPAVADWLLDRGAKPVKEMTAEEFRGFKDAIDSLDYIAREEQKIEISGAKRDFADYRKQVIENLKERPARSVEDLEKGGNWLYRLDAPMTRMEEIVKDIDLRKDLGPLYQGLIVPFEQSKAKSYKMTKDLAAEFKTINGFDRKWQRSLDTAIPNDFIFDTYNQSMFRLTRWNMVKMMLNWGNESNKTKLVEGIADSTFGGKATPEQVGFIATKIENLFNQHATKEDWTFVQKVWDIFDGFRKDVEVLERNMSGRVPKWIEGSEVVTPHGTFKGGYFPLIPDRNRNPKLQLDEAPDTSGPLGKDYFRATTNQNHLIARKNARYFVDITNGPEQLVGRMQQVIHDLSFRDFVKTAGKIIYDPELRQAFKKHYGPEYQAQMEPWLKRVANMATVNEAELQGFNDILGKARLNLIAAALPLNYSVMLSPSIGLVNPVSMMRFNSNRGANVKLVMENSKEIPNLLYTLDRDVNNALRTQLGKQGWTSFQLKAMETMFKPLVMMEQQFRMVTFYDEFTKQKGLGRTDYEASVLADSLVRERHSVSHTGDLPAILASKNEFVKMSTVFMGYFSTVRNWMRQIPELSRQGEYSQVAKVLWGTMGVATMMNAALFTKRKENEGFFKWMSRVVLSTPMMMVPFVRDAWSYAAEGFQPTSPLAGLITSVYEVGKDGYNAIQGKPVKKPVKHTINMAGQVFGVPGAMQMGRTGEFLYDVARKEQRPRDIVEWMRGIATGEAKLRKQ